MRRRLFTINLHLASGEASADVMACDTGRAKCQNCERLHSHEIDLLSNRGQAKIAMM
jgi:hypothetical protein